MDTQFLIKELFLTTAEPIVRYGLFSGVTYGIFWIWKKADWHHLRIQKKFPNNKMILKEIRLSIQSLLIFAAVYIAMIWAGKMGYLNIYFDIADKGWGYFALSGWILIWAHDTYFYWAHRAMHFKWIYRYVHKAHHEFHNPSPFCAFAFHPSEAILEAAFLPLIALIMPLHPIAILVFMLYMNFLNVLGHLGYEVFPKGFTKHWFLGIHNTSTHHNMHHKYVECNYGLYFNLWDRFMNTNHPLYHETFEELAGSKKG